MKLDVEREEEFVKKVIEWRNSERIEVLHRNMLLDTQAHLYWGRTVEEETEKRRHAYYQTYIAPFLPGEPDAAILDIGCGTGGILVWLKSLGYTNVEGIDASVQAVRVARERGLDCVRHADAFDFLLRKEKSYDVIIMWSVLEHFYPWEALALLFLIQRALKTGGRLIMAVPNVLSPFPAGAFGDPTHLSFFAPCSIRSFLTAADFQVVSIKGYAPRATSPIRLIWTLLHSFLRLLFAFESAVWLGSTRNPVTLSIVIWAEVQKVL